MLRILKLWNGERVRREQMGKQNLKESIKSIWITDIANNVPRTNRPNTIGLGKCFS